MTTVTLRLPEKIVHKIDTNAQALDMSRSEYIKKAILEMNKEIRDYKRRQKLMSASKRVRQESMDINAEFSAIENDPEA